VRVFPKARPCDTGDATALAPVANQRHLTPLLRHLTCVNASVWARVCNEVERVDKRPGHEGTVGTMLTRLGAPRRRAATALAITVGLVAAAALAGCYGQLDYKGSQTKANETACGAEDCHPGAVSAQAASVHEGLPCELCHKGTGPEHGKDPKKVIATTDWTVQSCNPCHAGEVETYLYDDNAQVGPFGGSQRIPPQPKVATFPEYKTIVAGHPFSRDYNEEGAHKFMLEDHYETTRGKFETCVQCKSSKIAYAWKEGKPVRVAAEQEITLTHTATQGVPPRSVKIPAGTTLTYATDPLTRLVDAKATLPDGTVYTSKPQPSEDATLSNNMIWASTIAAIKDTWPYGAGCNHCHDPHTGADRLLRQAMLQSIEGTGGPKGAGGVNPYAAEPSKEVSAASARDRRILACAQCHVEYTCGKSAIDRNDRDAYGWSKAADLHDVYTKQFGYQQDWRNAIIGQPLIKNQHPETELYWNSKHYEAGASCSECHMPEVRRGGKTFRSHWMTSPYKYGNAQRFAAFAAATKLDASAAKSPCATCHEDRTAQGVAQQRAFYAAQGAVEKLLAASVTQLGAVRAAGKDTGADYAAALEAHRRAHAIWENLAVSENSMGFHNFEECMTSMAEAKKQVDTALATEKKLLGK